MRHVAQICPDITHMMIRLVEFDLRKMAHLVLKVQHPHAELSIRALELNLTERQIKEPAFEFDMEKKGKYALQLDLMQTLPRIIHQYL
jgi:hypothetical protein